MRKVPFVLASTDHGAMIVNRLDYNTNALGTYGVGFQLLNNGSYEAPEIATIKSLLRERREKVGDGLVAIDCGANIGVVTVEMAREMQGWGSVLAFEAQERIFYALCGNIALANLFNATALEMAVGAEHGWIQIPKLDYTRSASFGSLELRRTRNTEYIGQSVSYSEKDSMTCEVMAIDDIIGKPACPRLDFLKIDVEGMEMDVLKGAEKSISQFRPSMLIEIIKSDREQIHNFLTEHDYSYSAQAMNWIAVPNVN